jgi:hypothetical protein
MEEDVFVRVLLVVVMLAANEALFVFTVLVRLFIEVAAELLFVVTVVFNDVIDEFREDDAA